MFEGIFDSPRYFLINTPRRLPVKYIAGLPALRSVKEKDSHTLILGLGK